MRQGLLTILLVAAVSFGIRYAEATLPDEIPFALQWVRTSDGWERRSVLVPDRKPLAGKLHPATVGAFQLCASLLSLAAFPAPCRQTIRFGA